jgi:hypothetical protein
MKSAMQWRKMGRILEPMPTHEWLASSAGPSYCFAEGIEDVSEVPVYVTGRDRRGRSHIGLVYLNPGAAKITHIIDTPVLSLGEEGTFDQNGTGYPCLVRQLDGTIRMYYTGWMPTVLVPWQNDLGLATSRDGISFTRYSRAPIMPRTDQEHLGIGSVHVIHEDALWRIWYTCFERWQIPSPQRHWYDIRQAESDDGLVWRRPGVLAVTYEREGEYVLGRPFVVRSRDLYLMWYSFRGSAYRIGLAISSDGKTWTRRDDCAGIDVSADGWDSEMVCYANVFRWRGTWYMLYNGNGYGRSGLGLALLVHNEMLV